MAAGRIVIPLVSLILIVGVVIGVVAVVHHRSNNNEANVSTSTKTVNTICQTTDFKDACVRSLSTVAKNESATPKDYLLATLHATVEDVEKAKGIVADISVDKETDLYHHLAVSDCKELMEFALCDLEDSLTMVADNDLTTVNDGVREILNWLTAVYAYESQCVDALDNPDYKSSIEKGMVNASQLTSNALYIFADISEILKAYNIPAENNNHPKLSRRLLEVGHDGYPTWFSAADRKLLAAQNGGDVMPNAVVAKDGSGQYKNIGAAVAAYPKNHQGRYVIHVKAGIYDEQVIVQHEHKNVFMYGDGPTRTIVTGQRNKGIMNITTQDSATFVAIGRGFIAKSMGFRNTIGPAGHQAVAFRSQSDVSAVFECRIEGYQDTLYYQTHRQFYRDCVISGTVDFIFGNGAALIQNSQIVVRRPEKGQFNAVTADGAKHSKSFAGVVVQNCSIVADKELLPVKTEVATYLGRPWKPAATTVVMESELGDFIHPEGYRRWEAPEGANNHLTCTYREFDNRGAGAVTGGRVKWKSFRVLTDPKEALQYTIDSFLKGGPHPGRSWVSRTGAPFYPGLTKTS